MRILRSTTGFAPSPEPDADQTRLYERTGESSEDTGLTNSTTYYYTAYARDETGNWSARATQRATPADGTAPETSGSSGPTDDPMPDFGFGGSDNATARSNLLYSHKVDDGDWSPYSPETSTTLGGAAGLADGAHTFYVKARDEAGNEDPSPARRTFDVYTMAPNTGIVEGSSGTVTRGGTGRSG